MKEAASSAVFRNSAYGIPCNHYNPKNVQLVTIGIGYFLLFGILWLPSYCYDGKHWISGNEGISGKIMHDFSWKETRFFYLKRNNWISKKYKE